MNYRLLLSKCIPLIEQKSGLGSSEKWVQRDFEKLSGLIEEETKICLSVSTLRRIWKNNSNFHPQKFTLDALAKYSGFDDWHDLYSRYNKSNERFGLGLNFARLFRRIKLIPTRIFIPYLALFLVFCLSLTIIISLLKAKSSSIIETLPDTELALISPEQVIEGLYKSFSFEKGASSEPEEIRSFFIEDASIILRKSKGEMKKYSVETFIEGHLQFSLGRDIKLFGYNAYADSIWSDEYLDIANVYAKYRATASESGKLMNNGFDCFQLIKTVKGWKISSIIGESYSIKYEKPPFLE